jgi:hypothetical protein
MMTSHLWILSKLIFPEKNENGFDKSGTLNTLLHYTITTCHLKMTRRFKHHLSQRLLESLGEVRDFPFNPALKVDTNLDKTTNDRALITGFVSETLKNRNIITTSIPNIQLLCNNLPPESEPFQLYTSETCNEFHNLVVELLNSFKSSCSSLAKSKDFNNTVLITLVLGHALLRIARGSAIEMHLQNIATLLDDHRNTEISMPMPDLTVDVENEDEELDEELDGVLDEVLDEELLPIQSNITDQGCPMPLWKTYRDWMRLMVVHFDAANILTAYAVSQNSHPNSKTISFKILVTPRVDEAFLPWSDLLNDPHLFPAADASGQHASNEDILRFLEDGLATVKAAITNEQLGLRIKKLWGDNANKNYKEIVKLLPDLAKLPKYSDSIKEISKLLSQWNVDRKISTLVEEIGDKIRDLNDRLTEEKNSLSFPIELMLKVFSGTLHCEISLASILHKGTRKAMVAEEYKDLLEQTEVDYHYSDLSML